MAVDGITGRVFREAAIPGLTDTGAISPVVSDSSGKKSFPTLTPAQSAANLKAAGADPSKAVGTGDAMTKAAGGSLDKNAFLKLLVQEMTNQDPLKPADNTAFIAQLAQFSTLEQMQNMNDGFKTLQSSFESGQAAGLLGKGIHAVDSSNGNTIDGTVDKVLLNSTGVQLDVNNGTTVNLSDVLWITPSGTPTATANAL